MAACTDDYRPSHVSIESLLSPFPEPCQPYYFPIMPPHQRSDSATSTLGQQIFTTEPQYIGSYPKTGIDVLIVGTGFAGLTAALECTRKGHSVRILERHSTTDMAGMFLTQTC